jgi:hypothetical protein
MNNYFLITTDRNSTDRNSFKCLGKLRAQTSDKDTYVLYNNGDAMDSSNPRCEYGAFIYRYEMCNVGNIRKMKIMLPNLNYKPEINNEDVEVENETDQINDDLTWTVAKHQPRQESQTLLNLHQQCLRSKQGGYADPKGWHNFAFRMFVDNPPSWNPKCNSYVYNFKGRVTEASIKNF